MTTMETTYAIQLLDRDGSWIFYTGYESEAEARSDAAVMYGGEVPTRIVRIEHHVVEG
jgi:hypothetical protein